jgi:hypothetical protein
MQPTCPVVHKLIEEYFGWAKTVGRTRLTVYRGLGRAAPAI